jgi:exopolysaccharide biosynthesis polyprenyl glycosylphosphotransferase
VVTDVACVAWAVALAHILRFRSGPALLLSHWPPISYVVVSVALILSWTLALHLFRSRDSRHVGTGAEEYGRVANASFSIFGTVAILSYLLKVDLARSYLAMALCCGFASLVLTRWLWRRWLVRRRLRGSFTSTVLVVGSHRAGVAMADLFEQDPRAGYRVVGVCVPGWAGAQGELELQGHAVPVLGDERAVLAAITSTGADMVAVSNTEFLGVSGMRTLAWQLESIDVDMVVSSGVMDVAGPRLHVHPVAGLPLLYVDKPQYRGASRVGKLLVDLVIAGVALVALAPLLVCVALAVKLTSKGPVFYRAERIGLNGRPFAMLKFRSMVVDADSRRHELVRSNEAAGPLFKIRADPRVTPVGRWIRRLSIDELPQLVNVLRGQMSVVGPRPPLRSEVVTYTGETHRRLLVKPGITGLWQVSGRSDLSWEESVRLDLFYVENWSMVQDLTIVWRTLGAVLQRNGAY